MNRDRLVLVVEDHESTRRMMSRALESAGFRAREAADAMEGIGMARKERPDLILMDVDLPGIGGDVAAGALKDDPLLGGVPVILVSATIDLDDRSRESGAEDILYKPFHPSEVVRRAHRWTDPARGKEFEP
jgi:CheY-like chemotaxis protein